VTAGIATLSNRAPASPPADRVLAPPLEIAVIVTKLTAGAGGVALRGAEALDQASYRATIFTAEGGSLIGSAESAGLAVVPLRHMGRGRGVYPGGDTRGYRELAGYLKERRFDLVHTHSSKAGALGRLAAHSAGVPAVVHTFHGFPFHDFQSAPVRRALIAAERRLARYTDYFLTAGTMVAAEALRLRIAAPDRIRTIDVPVDREIPAADPAARARARRRMGLPTDVAVVGTVARLSGQKAPLDMVRAMTMLARPDVYMVWLGGGELRDKMDAAVRRAGLKGRILLLGERDDVPELLPGMDVFALPSLYEGLPCAVVEAMISGIPVVATAVNSTPEIVLPGRTGLLVRPGDPGQLATALAFLLDHPQEAARMAREARARIGTGFRPDQHGQELDHVYGLARRFGALRTAKRSATGGG
jgi:glycosyltransferase involved in cell wall biosynthesis